jgi:hypothetical protein
LSPFRRFIDEVGNGDLKGAAKDDDGDEKASPHGQSDPLRQRVAPVRDMLVKFRPELPSI